MVTVKRLVIFSFFCFAQNILSAQPTSSYLAVKQYSFTCLPVYLKQAENVKSDTVKINLLLKISSICHWNGLRSSIDSSILFAESARILSKSSNYSEGHNEATFLMCKSLLLIHDFDAAQRILKLVYGEQYIRILLVLSEYFINNIDAGPADLRKAFPYLQKAHALSIAYQSPHWITESTIAQAKYHFRLKEIEAGKKCFYRVIEYNKNIGDKAGQAHWWFNFAQYIPTGSHEFETYCFRKSQALYRELGNLDQLADSFHEEAISHEKYDSYELAEKSYLSEMRLLQTGKFEKRLFHCYQNLSELYQRQLNLDRALQYAFLGLENLKVFGDSSQLDNIYWTIGQIYHDLGDHKASIKYYKMYLSTSPMHRTKTYTLLKHLVEAEIKTGNPAHGIEDLSAFIKVKNTPPSNVNQQLVAFLFGNCFAAMKDYGTAEKYYIQMIRLNKEAESSEKNWWRNYNAVAGAEAYLTIGKIYVETARFNQASKFLRKALTARNLTPVFERDVRYLLHQVDSAAGNYPTSIRNYKRYTYLKDSIQTVTKDDQVAVLKANFKAQQKENEVKLLQKESVLQKRQLDLSERSKKATYLGIIGLGCLLMLSLNSYRVKQRKNRLLEQQQIKINIKNSALLRLVDEKELLLKEVHHRVKNNLQIIIGLLNSQSVHLREETAINAIAECRYRIHAISMLHQRIYQSENMFGVAMNCYIYEMVYHLRDSFNVGDRINFNVRLDNIMLDLAQAVPVGLILNEGITNALKYAFPENQDGEIRISFAKTDDDMLTLAISDNGVGLADDICLDEITTFGLKLIRGLTEDLGGDFDIQGQSGTTLTIRFVHKLNITTISPCEDQLGAIEL